MSIKETYDEYKDQWGMVQVNKGGAVTQNGPRFTGEYVAALIRHKELDENTKAELRGTLELIEFPEGNLHRFPTSDEQQSVDDTVATLWWSAMVDDSFAHRWLMRGQESPTSYSSDIRFPFENKWWWRKLAFPILKALGIFKYTLHTAHPGQFSFDAWLGRMPQLVAHAKFCAGWTPSFFEKLWWVAAIVMSAKKGIEDQDGKVLSWFLVKAARGKSWMCDKAIDYWVKKFKTQSTGGIGQVLANYYDGSHPSARALQGEYGE
jgi:hypothetical protein